MEPTYTVTELSAVVARALARAVPDEIWVEGEIRDLARSRNGHVYFTLIDPDADQEPGPVLPVSLFASDRDAVNRVLISSPRLVKKVSHWAQLNNFLPPMCSK